MFKKTRKILSVTHLTALVAILMVTVLVMSVPVVHGQKVKTEKALVNLNTASEKELEDLKGIGPATAKKIIANRPYKSVDELSKAGVPAKTIEALKPHVTVGAAPAAPAPAAAATTKAPPKESAAKPATTVSPAKAASTQPTAPGKPARFIPERKVNINTARKEELDVLPGIGPVKAQAIIDGRPYKTIEDIMKVKGIKQGEFNKIKDFITVE